MKQKSKAKKCVITELTQEEKEKIIELRNEKLSLWKISNQLSIARSIVKKIIEKNSKPSAYKKYESSLTKEEKDQIRFLRNNSKTPSEISKQLKIDLNLVKVVLQRQNYSLKWKKFRENEKAFSGIYMIRNDINGKVYIGQSQDIITRWHQHLVNKVGKHSTEFVDDLNKYGLSAFSFKVLICHPNLTKEQLFRLENTFIRYYDSIKTGYNKIYSRKNSFYDIDLKGKTMEEILEFVFNN